MTFDFWPGYLEIARKMGLDFVVVDTEHGQLDPSHAETLCRTARLLDLPLLMRPQSCQADLIKRCLDQGAGGLMVPWVECQEQLDILYAAAFCPPRGRHGMGGPAILAVDGVGSADWARIEDNTFIMCQVETPKGMEFAGVIASQPWVDAVMVGPYDLAHNLGLLDQYMTAPGHVAAIERIGEAARRHGKPAGMVVGTGEDARAWFDKGFQLVICGCVMGHVRQSLARNIAAARRSA
jgi:2-keto-3-deoxy-L-rhamnonate aldolase RhmA